MGNTRDFFGKIGDIKGLFHARVGTIKDRNGKNLTEAEETKKRWQEYTEELYKKVLMTWITTRVCSLTWSVKSSALGSIIMNKASGGDGIPVELFQILKDDAVMMLNMPANLENSAVVTGLEKSSFHSNPKGQCQ